MADTSAILQKLMPHLCISRWGSADTETIMRDIIISKEKNLSAISVEAASLAVASSLAPCGIKIFAFTDDPAAARPGASIQLFARPDKFCELAADIPGETILAIKLAGIEHLDWTGIILAAKKIGAAGFMFIDQNGKYLHKFYDFLTMSGESCGEIHYCGTTGDLAKLESARRLVEKICPVALERLRIFVAPDFFKNLDKSAKAI